MKLIPLILSLLLFSCSPPDYLKNRLGCFSENQISTIPLKLNGYYVYSDEYISILRFFNNGFCVEISNIDINSLDSLFNTNDVKEIFYNTRNQGIYEIINDTIHVKFIWNPGISSTWISHEKWLFLKNNNELDYISFRRLDYDRTNLPDDYYWPIMYNQPSKVYTFEKSSVEIPIHTLWLINKKWFWCNKEEYKKWVKKFKKSRSGTKVKK